MLIRKMTNDDIEFALSLTSIEGWSDIECDFEALVSYSPNASFVMESSDDYIGMVSAVSYGSFGFIGSLIVHPSHRGHGYGIQLLRYGIKHLQELDTTYIMLDAVPDAMALYEKHGFRPICKSYRLSGKVEGIGSEAIREISEEDFPMIFEIDRDSFGGDRSHFLHKKWIDDPSLCLCIVKNKRITAYVFGSHREKYVRVAPWIVTETSDFNGELLAEIAERSGDRKIAMGILETNKVAYDTAISTRLAEYSFSIRMVKGDIQPSFSPNQYAIGSPAKG
ncbi:MAG: GNAT family N-acetyltransferase [Candidatus Thorarchaeota archaeon]|jgi:ribosomal protein S18 acetylase RimI-like enzyme